jgi:CrtC N-terminal lipocalin domain
MKTKKSTTEEAWLASSDAEYAELKLKKGVVEKWEDGMRTTGGSGNYEWWYFDGKLADGSTMVVGFYTKLLTNLQGGLQPVIMVNIDYADGSKVEKRIEYKESEWSASTDQCNVTIGANYFRGNLEKYEIHFQDEEMTLDIQIVRETMSWRPETGHMMFGDEGDFFAWVVAVPQGEATVNYTYNGNSVNTSGSCYHDHNWGNKSLAELVNHWYWARAEVGAYSVIASEIIAEKAYGYDSLVVFNLSKDGKMVQDNGENVKLFRVFPLPDETTSKPVSHEIRFVYEDDKNRYELKLVIEKTLLGTFLAEGPMRMLSLLLTGTEAAYMRFTGPATLSVYAGGNLEGTYENDAAVWELMYFGK